MNVQTATVFAAALLSANADKALTVAQRGAKGNASLTSEELVLLVDERLQRWVKSYFKANKVKVNPSLRYPLEKASLYKEGTVKAGQDGEEYEVSCSTNATGTKVFRWREHGFRSDRRVPDTRATEHEVGYTAEGGDGRTWKVGKDANGKLRWFAETPAQQKGRKAPNDPAKNFDDGHVQLGNDSETQYKVMTDTKGIKRWVRADEATIAAAAAAAKAAEEAAPKKAKKSSKKASSATKAKKSRKTKA